MIVGHAAVALAAKARWPRLPIALLLVATFFADVADACLFWTVHPADKALWSHALVVLAPAAVVLAVVYGFARRDHAGGWILATVLMSHWVLDVITGAKLTWPGGPVVGLGLYDFPIAEFVVESALVAAAWYYVRRRSTGLLANWRIYAVLIAMQAGSSALSWYKHGIYEREGLPAEILNTP